jgi:histidinol-phosphate/aromatic aminotransferase/cobyric acid decarboxylase-like protein
LCEIGEPAAGIAADLMAEGLVVRAYPADGPLGRFLRFTVRSPEDDDRLLAALERRL